MTALHLAEQVAGRRMFIRWANGSQGNVITAECGGDSERFERLAPAVAAAETRVACGSSEWRVFDAAPLLEAAGAAIRQQPEITHCGNPGCVRCNDAVAGGPMV